MIEIKFWFDDVEGIRDFGILLLQSGYVYKLRKKEDFAIFSINIGANEAVKLIKSCNYMDDYDYCSYSLSVGSNPLIEFKAFALKIY